VDIHIRLGAVHPPTFRHFDFTGAESKFIPPFPAPFLKVRRHRRNRCPSTFRRRVQDPATILAEYARLTGKPACAAVELRLSTIAPHPCQRREIIQEAKTFREKKLPSTAMIYLGTGFCPSGWNTKQRRICVQHESLSLTQSRCSMSYTPQHMKVALHVVIRARSMKRHCARRLRPHSPRPKTTPSCFWDIIASVFNLGVDGWCPTKAIR